MPFYGPKSPKMALLVWDHMQKLCNRATDRRNFTKRSECSKVTILRENCYSVIFTLIMTFQLYPHPHMFSLNIMIDVFNVCFCCNCFLPIRSTTGRSTTGAIHAWCAFLIWNGRSGFSQKLQITSVFLPFSPVHAFFVAHTCRVKVSVMSRNAIFLSVSESAALAAKSISD